MNWINTNVAKPKWFIGWDLENFSFCKTFQCNGTFGLYFLYTFNSILMELHTTKHIHMVGKQLHFKLIIKTTEWVGGIRLWKDIELNIHI